MSETTINAGSVPKAAARVEQRVGLGGMMHGLVVTLIIAAAAFITWWFLKGTWLKFSALLWAFVYSIAIANIFPKLSEKTFKAGIDFSSSRMLRVAIGLLGLTVSASVWLKMGGVGLGVIFFDLIFAFLFSVIFCKYVLKMDDTLSILIGIGTGICGASAIAATGPAIKAKAEHMGLALAVITLFGLIAMFGYPFLYNGPLSGWLANNPVAFGMWSGTGIHETPGVIAAASQVGGALPVAISAKFIRIFMIGPMVPISMYLLSRFARKTGAEHVKMTIPWFAVAFVALTLVNFGIEFLPFSAWWSSFDSSYVGPAVTFLLAWAFAGVGMKVKVSAVKAMGLKAFVGGMVVSVVVGVVSLLMVKFVWLPFAG
ncbi:MAG: putative sulfate exporter family transporter [Chloroflexota bacterium]